MTVPVRIPTLHWDCSDVFNAKASVLENIKRALDHLKKRRGEAFLPQAKTSEERLDTFLHLMFPDGPVDFLACNVSLKDMPFLMIRHAVPLPSVVSSLPTGMNIAVKGTIDQRAGNVFRVKFVNLMEDCEARFFEHNLPDYHDQMFPDELRAGRG